MGSVPGSHVYSVLRSMEARLLLTNPLSVPPPVELRSGAYFNLYNSLGMNSEVNANTNAFISTAALVTASSTLYHAPISSARPTGGRLWYETMLMASTRISATAFIRANIGASGNAARNMVTKPYWRTENSVAKLLVCWSVLLPVLMNGWIYFSSSIWNRSWVKSTSKKPFANRRMFERGFVFAWASMRVYDRQGRGGKAERLISSTTSCKTAFPRPFFG